MPVEEEFYLRRLIRGDVKKILYLEDLEDGNESAIDPDEERRIEDKVQYGTDSESEFDRTDPIENYLALNTDGESQHVDDDSDHLVQLEFDEDTDGPEGDLASERSDA